MTVIYHEDNADFSVLAGKTLGVIGYTDLGKPAAVSARQSGIAVLVGCAQQDVPLVQGDGFTVASIPEIIRRAEVIFVAVPDEQMTQVYIQYISPHLKRGHTLILTSAYNVAFGFIEPPPFVDVAVIAPRTLPSGSFAQGDSPISFVSVWQDASRNTWQMTLAVALATGFLQAGAVEVTIHQEAEMTLFVQQAILPIIYHIMTTAAQLLMDQGYPPEAAFVDLYLGGKLNGYIQQMVNEGLLQAVENLPKTNQYAILSRLDRFNDLKLERLMEVTLDEIRQGDFAREWSREHNDGYPRLKKILKQQKDRPLWDLEQQTIELLNEDELYY